MSLAWEVGAIEGWPAAKIWNDQSERRSLLYPAFYNLPSESPHGYTFIAISMQVECHLSPLGVAKRHLDLRVRWLGVCDDVLETRRI